MVDRVGTGTLACIVVLAAVAGAVPVAAEGPPPTLDVSYEGSSVTDGETIPTADDPILGIDATARADGATMDEIVIRVDGETRQVLDGGDTISENVELDVSQGAHDVRIIATDSAGNVNSTRFEVFRDALGPKVRLRSPATGTPDGRVVNVSGPMVTLAGDITDYADPRKLRLTYENGNYSGGQTISDPGGNFSTTIRLAKGINDLRLVAEDTLGNARIYEFQINVSDGAPPTLALDDPPNVTTDVGLPMSGIARDDLWVKSVDVNATQRNGNDTMSKTLVGSQAYDVTEDRRSVRFDDEVLLELGTYDVTVTVTDVAGNNVSESFVVERKLPEEVSVAPEVSVDRERTLFVANRTVFVTGAVFDGEIRRVAVESRNASTDETVDYVTVHSGRVDRTVDVGTQIRVGPGLSNVILRATDTDGTEHATTFYVNATAGRTFVGESGRRNLGPDVTVTPLATGRAATDSANVEVSRVEAGRTVTVPSVGDARGYVTRSTNVTLSELTLTTARPSNFTLYVRTTEGSAVGSDFASATDASAVGTVTVEHAVDEGTLSSVAFRFDVRRSYLSSRDVSADNVTLYRRHDGNWSALPTDHLGTDGTYHQFRAESPGLSLFAVGAPDPAATSGDGGNESATDQASANATANETQANDGTESGSPDLRVTNVTLNESRIVPNGTVAVNVTVANEGDAAGSQNVGVTMNFSVVATERVTVAAGETETVTVAHSVAQPGNYSVTVNGTRGGYLLVTERGLLGGLLHAVGGVVGGLLGLLPSGLVPGFVGNLLAGLPLRLVGMALGAIVGVVVVASLGLRLVQRVGGSGESE